MEQAQLCHCAGGGMLPEAELWEGLDRVLEEYQGQPGALVQVLHKAQDLFGYLPMEVQERVAVGLGLPVSEVYGVVTFYSFFTMAPRGKHTVRVCLGTACYVRGGRKVLDSLQKELTLEVGGTTPDHNFSLEVVRCIGACGLAPVMTVGEDVYRRVKPGKVGELLGTYNGGVVDSAPE